MSEQPSRQRMLSKQMRAALWAGALIFLTAGYFRNSRPGWNVNSQFALACALAERGTFQIDAYHETQELGTGDKAYYNGHFYTDKSPVLGMLGAPIVWLVRQATLRVGIPFRYEAARWITGWVVVGGSAALLAALMAMLFIERGVRPADAARGGVLCIAATPLLGYSILFFQYLPCCALLMAGFRFAQTGWRDELGARRPTHFFFAGLLVGLACWTLNTAAVAAIALTFILAIAYGRRLMRIWPWVAGGIAGAAGYFIYNKLIFDSFGSPYRHEYDAYFREAMARGFMGASWPPKALAIALVTVLPFQGLFVWFPLTGLFVMGCVWVGVRGPARDRLESWAAIGVFLVLLVYTGAYFMWWGGWAYAPRHLLPAIPLLALGLAPLLRDARARRLVWVIGAVGTLMNIGAVAVDPQPPPGLAYDILDQPHRVEIWPAPFLELQRVFWKAGYTDHNFGTAMGLRGPMSMLPLAIVWIAAWLVLPKWLGERGRDE